MEGASQAIAFVAGKGQIGAAVRARPIEQTKLALLVPKEHQILTEQAHRLEWPLCQWTAPGPGQIRPGVPPAASK